MILAGVAWLAIVTFDVVQALRRKPTLSQAAWALGKRNRASAIVLVVLVFALTLHLLWPLIVGEP